jgi:hypothetical protein
MLNPTRKIAGGGDTLNVTRKLTDKTHPASLVSLGYSSLRQSESQPATNEISHKSMLNSQSQTESIQITPIIRQPSRDRFNRKTRPPSPIKASPTPLKLQIIQ